MLKNLPKTTKTTLEINIIPEDCNEIIPSYIQEQTELRVDPADPRHKPSPVVTPAVPKPAGDPADPANPAIPKPAATLRDPAVVPSDPPGILSGPPGPE